MPASSRPDPDDQTALTSRERRVLAGIEQDLAESDPRLAKEMSNQGHRPAPGFWPLSVPSTGLLFLVLLVLVLVGAFVPASWWAVLGVVTTLVVVPWLLLAATEKQRHD
jgi:hypothetical protein